MRRIVTAVLLAAATAAPRKRKLSLPRLGSIATKTGAPFLTSQPLLNLLLGIRLRYASWGAPVAHWWPRGGPSSKRAEVIDAPKPETDLRDPAKTILVVTTASVPWLTGTAINLLLRAAHLAQARPAGRVCLYLPWLEPETLIVLVFFMSLAQNWSPFSGQMYQICETLVNL